MVHYVFVQQESEYHSGHYVMYEIGIQISLGSVKAGLGG